jgi:Domain of unknown function (DUF4160)
MPTVLRWKGYKFVFFSLDEGEPPHIHVTKGGGQAKFWLSDCRLARARGFADRELRRIRKKVEENREELLRACNDHFRA